MSSLSSPTSSASLCELHRSKQFGWRTPRTQPKSNTPHNETPRLSPPPLRSSESERYLPTSSPTNGAAAYGSGITTSCPVGGKQCQKLRTREVFIFDNDDDWTANLMAPLGGGDQPEEDGMCSLRPRLLRSGNVDSVLYGIDYIEETYDIRSDSCSYSQ